MSNSQPPTNTAGHLAEINQLRERLKNDPKSAPLDVERLRSLLLATQKPLEMAGFTMATLRHNLIAKLSNGEVRALMLAEMDFLAKELGYFSAPPLQRLLIDQILMAKLRLVWVENTHNQCVVGESAMPLARGEYWNHLLSSAQARFLRAIETLARVQRLARNTPALQINIAREGGHQVNVQGGAGGEHAKSVAEPKAGKGPVCPRPTPGLGKDPQKVGHGGAGSRIPGASPVGGVPRRSASPKGEAAVP